MPYNYTGLTRNRSPRLASVKGRQDFSRMLRQYMTAQFPALRASKAADEEQRLQEKAFDLEKDRLAEEERQGLIGTGLSAASTATSGYMAAKDAGFIGGKAATSVPIAATQGAGVPGTGLSSQGATAYGLNATGNVAPATSSGLSGVGPALGVGGTAVAASELAYQAVEPSLHRISKKAPGGKSEWETLGRLAIQGPIGASVDVTKKAVKAITGWSW